MRRQVKADPLRPRIFTRLDSTTQPRLTLVPGRPHVSMTSSIKSVPVVISLTHPEDVPYLRALHPGHRRCIFSTVGRCQGSPARMLAGTTDMGEPPRHDSGNDVHSFTPSQAPSARHVKVKRHDHARKKRSKRTKVACARNWPPP